jgi:hypothetical protein
VDLACPLAVLATIKRLCNPAVVRHDERSCRSAALRLERLVDLATRLEADADRAEREDARETLETVIREIGDLRQQLENFESP